MNTKVIIIAEAGVNHNGNFENAKKLILAAANAGADYVKFQTFKADKLAGFQWIPNTTNYVYYTEGNSKMMQASVTDNKAKELVTLAEINSALGTKLKSFAGLEWIDSSSFLI